MSRNNDHPREPAESGRSDRAGRRNEAGSATIEAVIGVTAMILFLSVAVLGGRFALAKQSVQAAAADAARAASIERTQSSAQSRALAAAHASLANQKLMCASTSVSVDTSQFALPIGTPASVVATIRCDVLAGDLGLPAAATIPVEATMTSPIDLYRTR